MEISSKRPCTKRKRKKRNPQQVNKDSCVKPELFNGMSNWLNLQKVLDPDKKERVQESSAKAESKSYFSKQYKKKQTSNNVTREKSGAEKPLNKPQFKMEFDKKRASLTGSDRDLSDHSATMWNPGSRYTKSIAMDCEMVGTGPEGNDSILARVSIVNAYGEDIYDVFVKPSEKVTDYRTEISGVRPADLKKGKDLYEVQKEVQSILDGRRLVGHDLKHDFDVLFITHPKCMIRDTARYKPFREISGGKTPSLKKLAAVLLHADIQSGEHSSVEDAQAAMLIYLTHKKEWENSIKSTRRKRK